MQGWRKGPHGIVSIFTKARAEGRLSLIGGKRSSLCTQMEGLMSLEERKRSYGWRLWSRKNLGIPSSGLPVDSWSQEC